MMGNQPKFKRGIGKFSKSAVLVTFRSMCMEKATQHETILEEASQDGGITNRNYLHFLTQKERPQKKKKRKQGRNIAKMLKFRKLDAAAVIRLFYGVKDRKTKKSLGVLHQMRYSKSKEIHENGGPTARKL